MDPTVLASMVFVFSITFLGIGAGILKGRLKMRDQQKAALSASNRELGQKIERLEQDNADYARRLENLETIVVSQTWSAAGAPAAAVRHEVHTPATEEMNRQRAEQLARRLG